MNDFRIKKKNSFKVRHKVKEIIEFIQSDDRVREERLKAKKNRDKYVGIDSDNIRTSSSNQTQPIYLAESDTYLFSFFYDWI